jgi:hypothetical protein
VAQSVARGDDDCAIVDRVFLAALSRRPNETERDRMIEALKDSGAGQTGPKAIATARRQAVEDLYWAVLTSQEFLFNH